MNTRKSQWLRFGRYMINLDRVDYIEADENGKIFFYFTCENRAVSMKGPTSIDDIHHFLKYGKPKR